MPFNNAQEKSGSFLSILSNAGWLTCARLAGDFASLLLFILLSRHFGPVGIGKYAYGFAIAGLAYAAINLGIENYAIRECSCVSLEERRILIGRLVGTQFCFAVLVLFGLLGFLFVTKSSTETITIILLLSAYQVALAFVRTFFVPAFAQQSMAAPAVMEVVCRIVAIGVAILLVVYVHTDLVTALIPFPIAGIVLLTLACISARHYIGSLCLRISWYDATSIVRSVWPFAASVMVYHVYARADLIMLSLMLGDEAAGIYAPCLKFLEAVAIPLVFLGFAVYPILSQLFERDERSFLETGDSFFRAALIVGGLLAWALFFLVPLILVPLLGDEFVATAPLVKVMAILCLLMAVETTVIRLLLAAHLQISLVKQQFIGTVLNVLLNFLLIPKIGIYGAVTASIIAEIALCLLYFRSLKSRIDITILVKTLGLFLAPLSAAFLVGALLTWITPNEWLPAVATLAAFCVAVVGARFVSIPKIGKFGRR